MRTLILIILLTICCSKKVKKVQVTPEPQAVEMVDPVVFDFAPEKVVEGIPVIIKETVYFDFDKDIFNEDQVKKVVDFTLKLKPNQVISVVGGCCPIGTYVYNKDLGYRRAKYVQFFLSKFIKNEMLIDSYGEDNLITADPNYYHLNRRVKIVTR